MTRIYQLRRNGSEALITLNECHTLLRYVENNYEVRVDCWDDESEAPTQTRVNFTDRHRLGAWLLYECPPPHVNLEFIVTKPTET